jgi:hypothetical protein
MSDFLPIALLAAAFGINIEPRSVPKIISFEFHSSFETIDKKIGLYSTK